MAEEETELVGWKKAHVKTLAVGDVIALKTLVKVGSGRGASAGPVQPGMAAFEVTAVGRDEADRGWAVEAKLLLGPSTTSRVFGETDFVHRRTS